MKLLVLNWKMNPPRSNQAEALFKSTVAAAQNLHLLQVIVAPPYIYLDRLKKLNHLPLAAQDVFHKKNGPGTGKISALMLKNIGASYVIIGHSEQRAQGETDIIINQKVKNSLSAGLRIILCVGEKKKTSISAAGSFIITQLKKDLKGINTAAVKNKIIIAYEPIWAIGTGKNASPEYVAEIIQYIKKNLNLNQHSPLFLYGGSVTSQTISAYVKYKTISGVLVGGASLSPKEVKTIINRLKNI